MSTISGMACIGGATHHGGADQLSQEMAGWNPPRVSFDEAHLREKDKIDARTISSARDYPLVSNAFRRRIHRIIGPNYRIEVNPIAEFLPLDGMNAKDLEEYWLEWGYRVALLFEADTSTPDFVDVRGQSNFTQLLAQGLMGEQSVGEITYTIPFMREQLEDGIRPFGSAMQTIDPGRVYTPPDLATTTIERERVTAGFAFNKYGYSYRMYVNDHVKQRMSRFSTTTGSKKKRTWKGVRKKVDGVVQYVHVYDSQYAEMSRGRTHFSAGLKFTKMLHMAEQMVLRATRIQATYAAYIKTRFPEKAQQGLMDPADMVVSMMNSHKAFYDKAGVPQFDGAPLRHVMPGDELVYTQPNQPIDTFVEMQSAMLRHIAAACQMGHSTFSGDYRRASFSSVQAEALDNYQTDQWIKSNIVDQAANPYVKVWLEENIANGRIPIRGLTTSRQRRAYYRQHSTFLGNICYWGAPREHTDPIKQSVGDNLEMDDGNGARTMEMHLAQRYNMPLRQWLKKKAREKDEIIAAGLEHLIFDEDSGTDRKSGRVRTTGSTKDKLIGAVAKNLDMDPYDPENGQHSPN